MLKKLVKILFKSGKKATKTTSQTMDMLDNLIEKEYITSAVDNLKTSSGKIVEKAGMVYQQTKDVISDNIDAEKIKEVGEKIVEKGKQVTSGLSDRMEDTASTLKNVMEEGEKMVKDVLDSEEE